MATPQIVPQGHVLAMLREFVKEHDASALARNPAKVSVQTVLQGEKATYIDCRVLSMHPQECSDMYIKLLGFTNVMVVIEVYVHLITMI